MECIKGLKKGLQKIKIAKSDIITVRNNDHTYIVLLEGPRERAEPVYEGEALGLRPSPRSF